MEEFGNMVKKLWSTGETQDNGNKFIVFKNKMSALEKHIREWSLKMVHEKVW